MEKKQQPTLLQKRNKASGIPSLGNEEDSRPDLQQTIENLRQSYPLLADKVDEMIANQPTENSDESKLWLFLHGQLSYTKKFIESEKNLDYFAPPHPPSSLTISLEELKNIKEESLDFVQCNLDDIEANEAVNLGPTPQPMGRNK